ncbi:hypothetical protein AB0K48_56480, partial [Nonomuraea sp. NPDC055795]
QTRVVSASTGALRRRHARGRFVPPGRRPGVAREAFTTSLNVAAGVGAVVLLGAALLSAVALRMVPPTSAQYGEEPERAPEETPVPDQVAR